MQNVLQIVAQKIDQIGLRANRIRNDGIAGEKEKKQAFETWFREMKALRKEFPMVNFQEAVLQNETLPSSKIRRRT